jgi:hypothetical protein
VTALRVDMAGATALGVIVLRVIAHRVTALG